MKHITRDFVSKKSIGDLNSMNFEEKLAVLRAFEMQETRVMSIIYLRAHIFALVSPDIMINMIINYANAEDINIMVNQPLREYLYPHIVKEDRATIFFTQNKNPHKFIDAYK